MKNENRLPTRHNIWAGSYDVWSCEQGEINSVEIPKRRMQEALDAGLIKSVIRRIRNHDQVIYSLTEAGKNLLKDCP